MLFTCASSKAVEGLLKTRAKVDRRILILEWPLSREFLVEEMEQASRAVTEFLLSRRAMHRDDGSLTAEGHCKLGIKTALEPGHACA